MPTTRVFDAKTVLAELRNNGWEELYYELLLLFVVLHGMIFVVPGLSSLERRSFPTITVCVGPKGCLLQVSLPF